MGPALSSIFLRVRTMSLVTPKPGMRADFVHLHSHIARAIHSKKVCIKWLLVHECMNPAPENLSLTHLSPIDRLHIADTAKSDNGFYGMLPEYQISNNAH